MTTTSIASRLAAAAAFTGLLLLAPIAQAEAKDGASVKTTKLGTAVTTDVSKAYGYTPPPVVRDHRKNPQPWSLPRHYHRHDRRPH